MSHSKDSFLFLSLWPVNCVSSISARLRSSARRFDTLDAHFLPFADDVLRGGTPVKRGPGGGSPRFTGHSGKRRLVEALRAQALVAGDIGLAGALLNRGALKEYAVKQKLTTQGAPDNDIFLIVSGTVAIRINGRDVAIRNAGTHVGEMALVDPLARRSATVVAVERTIALRVEEHYFT